MKKQFGLLLLMVTALASGMVGCSGSGNTAVNIPQYPQNSCFMWGSTVSGAQADQCCSNGVPVANPPSGVCPGPPAFAATRSSMASFAAAARIGQASLAAANALVGNTPTTSNLSAATAVDATGNPGSKAGNVGGAPVLGNLFKPQSAGSGGAAGSGGGVGAGGFGGGNGVTTLAAAEGVRPQAVTNDAAGTVYAAGGGGGAKGSAATAAGMPDFSSLFGGGGKGGGANAHAGSVDFGSRGPASDSSMASADPTDYFARTSPADNLFKLVERRYGQKAKNWALTDATSAASDAKRLSQ